jgi:hypothetical protein
MEEMSDWYTADETLMVTDGSLAFAATAPPPRRASAHSGYRSRSKSGVLPMARAAFQERD